jgi:DTW domain-containing protein YfiP
MCEACRRPLSVCYCAHVTKIATRTRVVILQHPRERDVPINTARIASLCLPDAELAVGVRWEGTSVLARALSDPSRPAALLYPGVGAIDVEASPPAGPITLVAIDGTWWQAKKVLRENPTLAALPRYAFRPPRESEYRIRREPREDYVSTIEALVHVLSILERDRDRFAQMLAPFRAMVDAQLDFAARNPTPRRLTRRAGARTPVDPRARLPALLRERANDLVCVHGEANAWPYGTTERNSGGDELVQWSAYRVATGEIFHRFVAPSRALAPATSRHLEVDGASILGGVPPGELFAAWSRFVHANDVLCSWGTYAPGLFLRAGGALGGPHVDIRRAARLYARSNVGTMDLFLARAALGPTAAPCAGVAGRAGTRLGQLVAICRGLTSDR